MSTHTFHYHALRYLNQVLGKKQYIKNIARKKWFHGRVLDMKLWFDGAR